MSAVNFYKDFFGTNIAPGSNYRSIDLINTDTIPTSNNEKQTVQNVNHRDIQDETLAVTDLRDVTSFLKPFKEENAAKTHEDEHMTQKVM